MLSRFVLKPRHCAFAFGIPTTEEDFKRDQHSPAKDFAKLFGGIGGRFVTEFAEPLGKIESKMSEFGVTVSHRVTLDSFAALLEQPELHMVVLFSHARGGRVEFHDGLKTPSEIIARIPNSHDGVLELCVCCDELETRQLPVQIRRCRPKCLVRFAYAQATPLLWLNLYLAFFRVLATTESTYFEALTAVTEAFRETTKPKRNGL